MQGKPPAHKVVGINLPGQIVNPVGDTEEMLFPKKGTLGEYIQKVLQEEDRPVTEWDKGYNAGFRAGVDWMKGK